MASGLRKAFGGIRGALEKRRVAAFQRRLESPDYAPLKAVPFSYEFKSRLKYFRKGVYRHPDGLFVKVGPGLEKSFKPKGHPDAPVHEDYALTFPAGAPDSRRESLRAATLHARFYRCLVRDGAMHPKTKIILHAVGDGIGITVISPEIRTRESKNLGYMRMETSSLLAKLCVKYPGFSELSHPDVLNDGNYGQTRALTGLTPKPMQRIGNTVWYLHDLHVFNDPHSPKTLEWLEKILQGPPVK